MIESTRKDDDLTVFTCTGLLTPDEIRTALSTFYAGTPTLHTLWDYTACDLSEITGERIQELAGYLTDTSHSRSGGRSALLYSMEQLTDIADRLAPMAELAIEGGSIKIFSDKEKAMAWITDPPSSF